MSADPPASRRRLSDGCPTENLTKPLALHSGDDYEPGGDATRAQDTISLMTKADLVAVDVPRHVLSSHTKAVPPPQ